MDELFLSEDWAEPDSLVSNLREALPDEYIVLNDLTVHRRALDAVVVGPQCLVVLYARDWAGEVRPAPRGPWRVRLDAGREVRQTNPAEEARQAEAALRAFLRDELPALEPAIRHLVVLTNPEGGLIDGAEAEPPAVTMEGVAQAITSMQPPPASAWLDGDARLGLALALRERRLTTSQRASEPFVFRSGGVFGSGKKVWTIRAAVRHMDRHPEDGIFHLHNGTLARWLSDQGAEALAGQAREVMGQRYTEPRVPLERFLIGTGLVRRPRLSVRPGRVSLGHTLAGQACNSRLRVRKGRGRGYLFGTLRTSEPWLTVEPKSFNGRGLEAVITADTELLPISRKPWTAEVLVDCCASEEPVPVPAEVRVMAMPSGLNRYLFRPLAGALSAGLLGAAFGWALGRWGLGPPDWFGDLAPMGWEVALAGLVGLFWAVLGGIRGYMQPLAWPISYATGRWLSRTLVWAVALVALAAAGHWAWGRSEGDLGLALQGTTTLAAAVLSALAFSIVPAVIGEIGAAHQAQQAPAGQAGRALLRPLILASAGVALVLLLVAGTLFLGPVWRQLDMDARMVEAGEWAGEQLARADAGINDAVDQLIIRYYDPSTPAQGQTGIGLIDQVLNQFSGREPVPTVVPRPTPTAGSTTP